MHNEKQIEQILNNTPELNVPEDLLSKLQADINLTQTPESSRQNIWSFIMNKRITKFAAAAVIIVAVGLLFTVMEKTTTPAYAIEQTVEALENIRFLHYVKHDDSGQVEDERWIEIGSNGRQVRYRQDTPPDFLAVEDGETTAEYHKDKKTVVLYSNEDKQYQWIGPIGAALENLRLKGRIIDDNVNYNGKIVYKILWPALNTECLIDPDTKLPLIIGDKKMSYEQPPAYIFEIEIPQDFAVIDRRPGAELTEEPEWLTAGEDADELFHRARYALISGDNKKASELFEYVVKYQPRRNWAWYWLGKAYYGLGEYELAVEKFSEVIGIVGGAYANLSRGLAYKNIGMEAQSQDDLNIALPWMIRTLSEPSSGYMFEYADDPTIREGKATPTERHLIERMIVRLRAATGMYFCYNFNLSPQENAEAIAAWQNWHEER